MSDDVELEKIWDLPTRLFHWALAGSVGVGWALGEMLSFRTIDWHMYAGYVTGGLLVFRVIWGLIGPPPARLWRLIPKPATLIAYLRHIFSRAPSHWPGHNPLGGLAVAVLLLILSAQVVTGLMSFSDSYFAEGPLAQYVSGSTQIAATAWHAWLQSAVVIFVLLHVAAIAFYGIWKREDLVRPMITGWKRVRRLRRD